VPKQFWLTPHGVSLLELTLSRLAPLAAGVPTTVVIDRAHATYVGDAGRRWAVAHLLRQPGDRGTAAGVLFALTPALLAGSADAVVIVTPSDHAVSDPVGFRAKLREAVAAVRSTSAEIILFGVTPDTPATDYGWISRGSACRWSERFHEVNAFVEKPDAVTARRLFAAQALWNTMVLVARARTLAALYEAHLPQLADVLAAYRRQPPRTRDAWLSTQYPEIPRTDFCRDVLAQAAGLAVCTLPRSIGWTDLGTPARLSAWVTETSSLGAA
jgi:mannose-1-phosphate guanylyltransferase